MGAAAADPPARLTLQEAVRLARDHHPTIEARRGDLMAARGREEQALARMLPSSKGASHRRRRRRTSWPRRPRRARFCRRRGATRSSTPRACRHRHLLDSGRRRLRVHSAVAHDLDAGKVPWRPRRHRRGSAARSRAASLRGAWPRRLVTATRGSYLPQLTLSLAPSWAGPDLSSPTPNLTAMIALGFPVRGMSPLLVHGQTCEAEGNLVGVRAQRRAALDAVREETLMAQASLVSARDSLTSARARLQHALGDMP